MNTLQISKKLFEHYESIETVNNYYGLLAYYALCQTALTDKDDALIEKCVRDIKTYPATANHTHYNFDSYRIGGNGKAYLIYEGFITDRTDELREYAQKTLDAPLSDEKLMCMPSDKTRRQVWIDYVTAITPFMMYASLVTGEDKYLEFGARQCFDLYELLMDRETGLLHQSRGFMKNPDEISHDHWSRGNGWGICGLAELVRVLDSSSPIYKKAAKYLAAHIDACLNYRMENKLWNQEMTRKDAWCESSGSALIIYALGVAIRFGVVKGEKYTSIFKESLHALYEICVNDDFSTNHSCPGCLCPGEGDIKGTIEAYLTAVSPSRDEHHSFGALMLAFTEGYRNGVEEL